jgi:F420H(2)-dependent quinone reductase
MTVDKPSTQPPSSGGVVAALRRFTSGANISLYRLTNGAVGAKMGGRSILLLTTIGRKSGKERVTPLLYLPEGNHFVVIASNWGEANHPMWWLNLQANPRAKIQIGPKIIPVTARQASPEERQRLWPVITSKYSNYADYEKSTTREIPVVILTPGP